MSKINARRIAAAKRNVSFAERRLGNVLCEELKRGMRVCWDRNGAQFGIIKGVVIKLDGSAAITVINANTHREYRIGEYDLLDPDTGKRLVLTDIEDGEDAA